MSDLQERLRTASNLARLEAVIELSRRAPALAEWPQAERVWFTELLSPFALGTQEKCRLSSQSTSTSRSAGAPLVAALIDELMKGAGSPAEIQREFTGLVDLLKKLLAQDSSLDQDDADRMNRIATMLRRRLLQDTPVLSKAPGLQHVA